MTIEASVMPPKKIFSSVFMSFLAPAPFLKKGVQITFIDTVALSHIDGLQLAALNVFAHRSRCDFEFFGYLSCSVQDVIAVHRLSPKLDWLHCSMGTYLRQ